MRRTKIVCTIGPATSSRENLLGLIQGGMDVARLNFSHGTHTEHAGIIAALRSLAGGIDRQIAILQDLSGPKVRLGELPKDGISLTPGQTVEFSLNPGSNLIPLPVPELIAALKPGDRLLADDGCIALKVLSKGAD